MSLPRDYESIHGWCTRDKAEFIMKLVRSCAPQRCVELGVFAGRSLLALALAAKSQRPDAKVIGIDAWAPNAALAGENDAANDEWWKKVDYDYFYNYTQRLMQSHNVADVVELRRQTSTEAANTFAEDSIDILHQDSNHSELISCNEVELYWNKVRPQGYWIFDDTDWKTTQRAQQLLQQHGYWLVYMEANNKWQVYQRKTPVK